MPPTNSISFKAVIFDEHGHVLLGRNPRDEWELLGGRADLTDATPGETIRRELMEEAGIPVDIGPIIDVWFYDIPQAGRVTVVSYLAEPADDHELTLSREHQDLRFFSLDALASLPLPDGYRKTIVTAAEMRRKAGQ